MYGFQFRKSYEEKIAMEIARDELGSNYPTHNDWIKIILYTKKVWFNHKDIGVYGEYSVTRIMKTVSLKCVDAHTILFLNKLSLSYGVEMRFADRNYYNYVHSLVHRKLNFNALVRCVPKQKKNRK